MGRGLFDGAGEDLPEAHDINVTPFIDVMLVLLIVFMIAAPLATVDVNVDLPASTGAASARPDSPVFVTVGPDLAIRVGDHAVRGGADMAAAIDAATGGDRDARLFLRADRAVAYGEVMAVMNALREAGWTRIALVGLETAGAGP